MRLENNMEERNTEDLLEVKTKEKVPKRCRHAYLGVQLITKREESTKIKASLTRVPRSIAVMRHILTARNVSRNTKLRIYKTVIRLSV